VITRLVALGASNLARGMGSAVAVARAAWGPRLEVVGAFGPGRSYGMDSSLMGRRLPGILDCGLWPALRALPAAPTRALVTDVGNDILYHVPVPRIVSWVDEAVARLAGITDDIVLTGLPLDRIRLLSPSAFLFFRTVLVPKCRLTRAQTLDASERVNEELRAIADRRGARFVEHRLEWYGADPVHIRPRQWASAWQVIVTGEAGETGGGRTWEAWRLFMMKPERRWWLGVEQRGRQPGLRLASGPTVWCY
jgi:hypothetical protein